MADRHKRLAGEHRGDWRAKQSWTQNDYWTLLDLSSCQIRPTNGCLSCSVTSKCVAVNFLNGHNTAINHKDKFLGPGIHGDAMHQPCTSQNSLEIPNLIWAIVGLAGTSTDQVGPTLVQTLLRPVETWTRDLWECPVMSGTKEFESFGFARGRSWIHTNARTQDFPAEHSIMGVLSMFLLSESEVYCCDSSVFISVALTACFHCPKVSKESKKF